MIEGIFGTDFRSPCISTFSEPTPPCYTLWYQICYQSLLECSQTWLSDVWESDRIPMNSDELRPRKVLPSPNWSLPTPTIVKNEIWMMKIIILIFTYYY